MNRKNTRGYNQGGFRSRIGGWTQYSGNGIRDNTTHQKVDTAKVINKQIKKDAKEIDDHLKKESTSIDTTDREMRKANEGMMPAE
jgi:hypothetical protein